MDAISNFLLQKKNLVIPVLFSTLYHLQVIQLQQPNLSFADLEETLKTVSGNASTSNHSPIAEDEIKAYAGIIYEACTVPKMGVDGPMFSLDEALTLGDQSEQKLLERFLKVFSVRDSKLGGKYSSVIEEWKKEGKKFVQQESSTEKESSDLDEDLDKVALEPEASASHSSYQHASNHVSSYVPRSSLSNGADSRPHNGPIESNKFVARFLAHMRRSGMDMVFPQLIHDKVLMTVYIAAKCSGPIAHRDLIDMILAAKDAQILGTDLELVSKTKVRGVVTLARNSHALVVVEKGDGQGETVKLAIGKGITTFKAFRKMHDSFLNLCLSQRHLFLPVNVKGEILWATDDKFAAERCHELMRDEAILENFFLTGGKKSSPTFPSAESKTSFESARPSVIGGFPVSKQDNFSAVASQKPVSLPPAFGYEVSKPSNAFDFSESSFGNFGGNRGFLGSSNAQSEQFSFGSSALSRNEFSHSRYNDEKDLSGFSSFGRATQNDSLHTLVHGHGQGSQGLSLPQTRSFNSANAGYNNNNNNSSYYHHTSGGSPTYRNEEKSNLPHYNDNTPFSTYSSYYSSSSASNNYKF
eukprot:gene12374-13527_t